MRMIKSDHWNVQGAPDRDPFPPNLIRIARLENVRSFAFDNVFDCAQVQERPITGGSRNQWRTNRINARPSIYTHLGVRAGHNEHMLVTRRVLVDVNRLFLDIALHSATEWRIELGEVADLQSCCGSRAPLALTLRQVMRLRYKSVPSSSTIPFLVRSNSVPLRSRQRSPFPPRSRLVCKPGPKSHPGDRKST